MNDLLHYVEGPVHDFMLFHWHSMLWSTEDGDKVLPTETQSLSIFYSYIKAADLTFKADDSGIWFAAWTRPALGGAQFDMWVAPRRRNGKGWLRAMEQAVTYAFTRYNVLLGLTTQENLLDEHRRMGYSWVGTVPFLWDGDKPVHVMYLTKDGFDARKVKHG